jgi:hypothetical protein
MSGQTLLFGRGRHGTRQRRLSATELTARERAREITAYIAQGGQVVNRGERGEIWRLRGQLHRLSGPALSDDQGNWSWFHYGDRHRIGGPAMYEFGHYSWWQNGKLHRDDGPAVVRADGSQEWYHYGKLDRQDGPAMIAADGSESYWLDQQQLSYDDWQARTTVDQTLIKC